MAKGISVGAEVSDSGTLSYQWYVAESKLSEGTAIENADSATFTPETTKTGTSYYYCVITNRLGSSIRTVISPRITYTVNEWICAQEPVIIKYPESIQADFGENFSLATVAYSADGGTLSYQWYFCAGKDGDPIALTDARQPILKGKVSSDTLGYYYCEITNVIPDNGDGGEKSASVRTAGAEVSSTQIKAQNPVVLQQPQNIKQDFGSTFTLSVTTYSADGGTLSYQWYYTSDGEAAATPISGATKATYTSDISARTLGQYYCEITNTISDNGDGGSKTATVRTNTTEVSSTQIKAQNPVVLQQPQNIKQDFGSTFTLSVTAYSTDGGTLSYQWYYKLGEEYEATKIISAVEPKYEKELSAQTLGWYFCEITNTIPDNGDGGAKTAVVRTNEAAVSNTQIAAKSPLILQQPQSIKQDFGSAFALSTTAYSVDGGTLSYQWYHTLSKETEAMPVSGATEPAYSGKLSAQTLGWYFCEITNTIPENGDGGKKTANIRTSEAEISNNQVKAKSPVILQQPQNIKQDFGSTFTLSVTAYSADGGMLSYQWYHKASEKDEFTKITGAVDSKYEKEVSAQTLGWYSCEITNTISDNGDGGEKTASVQTPAVTVSNDTINANAPVILTTLEDVALHVPEKTTLTVSAYSADKGTLSYQWHKTEGDTDTAIAGETKSSCTVTAEKVGSAEFYCVVTNTIADNGDGGTKTATARSNSAKVTVSRIDVQKPVILTTLEDVALHVPEKATLTVSAYATDGGKLSYQWYKTEDDKTAAIEGATESAYDVVAEKVGSAEFYCVVTNTITDNGDGGTKTATARSNSAKVTVSRIDVQKPVILTELKDVSLHVPEKTTLIVLAYSTDGGKLSYQWYKTEDDKTAAIEGATESAYDAVAEKVGSAEFYCVVTSTITDNGDGGVKTDYVLSNSAKITVEQVDVQKPVIKMQPKDATVVIPAIQAFSVNAYAADDGILTYQWYSVPDGQTAGTAIEGETNARLIVRVQELGKTGYYCIVTNTIDDNGDGGTKLASVQTDTAWFDAIYLKNVVSAPAFTKQPPALNVAPYNQHIEISCEAESAQGNVSYRWYQSTDGTTDTGIPVIGATTQTLTTPFYTERGIHYYYCVATTILSAEDGESIKSAASFSDIVTVACTGLPLLTITTVNGEEPTCDYVNAPAGAWGQSIANATKVPARMIMTRGNETVYDSGDYIAKTSGLTIKIRGNTSAYGIKKPYKLKLQKKADLLRHRRVDEGDYLDKNWILLNDYNLKSKIGWKVADVLGFAWTPEYDYVDVVINGTYRGVYMLIESIERGTHRINVKKTGFIIERGIYWWKDNVYFETNDSAKAYCKWSFKYPDPDDEIVEGDENFEYIKDYVNTAYASLSRNDYDVYIDVNSFANWLLAHDILGTNDYSGSNLYFSKYDQTDSTKLKMETPWDLDSIYTTTSQWSNIHTHPNILYIGPLLYATNKAFVAQYKQKWADVKDSVWADIKTDLNAFAAETEEGLNIARKLDAEKYGITYKTVSEDIADAENWFSSRLTWLNTQITALSE